jgi:hypothetical protein
LPQSQLGLEFVDRALLGETDQGQELLVFRGAEKPLRSPSSWM